MDQSDFLSFNQSHSNAKFINDMSHVCALCFVLCAHNMHHSDHLWIEQKAKFKQQQKYKCSYVVEFESNVSAIKYNILFTQLACKLTSFQFIYHAKT